MDLSKRNYIRLCLPEVVIHEWQRRLCNENFLPHITTGLARLNDAEKVMQNFSHFEDMDFRKKLFGMKSFVSVLKKTSSILELAQKRAKKEIEQIIKDICNKYKIKIIECESISGALNDRYFERGMFERISDKKHFLDSLIFNSSYHFVIMDYFKSAKEDDREPASFITADELLYSLFRPKDKIIRAYKTIKEYMDINTKVISSVKDEWTIFYNELKKNFYGHNSKRWVTNAIKSELKNYLVAKRVDYTSAIYNHGVNMGGQQYGVMIIKEFVKLYTPIKIDLETMQNIGSGWISVKCELKAKVLGYESPYSGALGKDFPIFNDITIKGSITFNYYHFFIGEDKTPALSFNGVNFENMSIEQTIPGSAIMIHRTELEEMEALKPKKKYKPDDDYNPDNWQ